MVLVPFSGRTKAHGRRYPLRRTRTSAIRKCRGARRPRPVRPQSSQTATSNGGSTRAKALRGRGSLRFPVVDRAPRGRLPPPGVAPKHSPLRELGSPRQPAWLQWPSSESWIALLLWALLQLLLGARPYGSDVTARKHQEVHWPTLCWLSCSRSLSRQRGESPLLTRTFLRHLRLGTLLVAKVNLRHLRLGTLAKVKTWLRQAGGPRRRTPRPGQGSEGSWAGSKG